MFMLDEIMKVLEDAKWHNVTEITDKTGMSTDEVLSIVTFLSKFGFAQLDVEEKRMRLDREFLKLPSQS